MSQIGKKKTAGVKAKKSDPKGLVPKMTSKTRPVAVAGMLRPKSTTTPAFSLVGGWGQGGEEVVQVKVEEGEGMGGERAQAGCGLIIRGL